MVYCDTHNPRGSALIAHEQTPECRYPHAVGPSGSLPSMTDAETLDPREARAEGQQ